MPIIRRILFPVDFSWKCLGTSRYVEGLAGQFEPEVLLLYVVPCGEQILAEELLLRRQTQLAQFFADGVNYKLTELCVVGEDAAAAILETVRTWKPDLVMMPTSGLGVMKRLMTGSVTANVLRAAACPVWTGSETETAPEPEAIHCRRVLCALEMSEHSQAVLEWAAWLAGQYDARLAIVHVTRNIPVSFDGIALDDELQHKIASDARMRMEALQLAAGTASEVFFESGVPADVVAEVATTFSADLVMVGWHAESAWDVLPGSQSLTPAALLKALRTGTSRPSGSPWGCR